MAEKNTSFYMARLYYKLVEKEHSNSGKDSDSLIIDLIFQLYLNLPLTLLNFSYLRVLLL